VAESAPEGSPTPRTATASPAALHRRPGRRRSQRRRAFLALSLVAAAETLGTVGFHLLEKVSWINAFYFESMLATGQGPPFALATSAGKLFASFMGYVSVGSTLSAVVFVLGPILARAWRGFVEGVEQEATVLEHRVEAEVRRLEHGPGPGPEDR
jgi:hypothetical protein